MEAVLAPVQADGPLKVRDCKRVSAVALVVGCQQELIERVACLHAFQAATVLGLATGIASALGQREHVEEGCRVRRLEFERSLARERGLERV